MDISEYFCCDNSGTLFHVNSNLIYNIGGLRRNGGNGRHAGLKIL